MTKRSRPSRNQRPTDSSVSTNSSVEKSRKTPLWQAVVLPLAAILIFFLLLEGGLALFGVKPALQEEDPFVGFAANVPLFVPEQAPGGGEIMTTAPNKLQYFNAQSFSRHKAPGTYRIFCLGGSTTYGRPYNDTTAFSGWLRELLPKADARKPWEVINAGGISYASYRVAHLMEELVNYQPDLFVIYTGHNEFLEERTYHKLKQMPAALRSAVGLLAHTRTWAAMKSAMKGMGVYPREAKGTRDKLGVEVNAILDRSAGPERYSRDDQLRANILEHYRISLERMVELARSVGAKVIFVTPASNLKDCSPFKSQHTDGLDAAAQQRSDALLAKAREAIGQKDWNGALASLDTALAFDPRDAELLYRRGRVLLALGRYDEAEKALRQARDEDVCPLRALTPMRRIVTEVASKEGVALVDYVEILRQRMEKEKGYPIPGKEYFLDHVHPTIEGNRILAVALIRKMIDQGLVQPGSDWGAPAIAEVAKRVEEGIDQPTHGLALANLARVLLWAGKTEDAERLARQALDVAGEDRDVAVNAVSTLTSVYQRQKNPVRAVEMLYSAVAKAPGAMELRIKLGEALLNPPFQEYEKAAGNLLLVCQQVPDYDVAHQLFGLAMARRGFLGIAYANLQEALRLNPKNSKARMLLAQIQPMLEGRTPDTQLADIELEIYPSVAPRKLVQVRHDASGRTVADGIEVEFYENGRIKHFADIDRGVPNGFDISWNADGKQTSRVMYQNGTPLKDQPK